MRQVTLLSLVLASLLSSCVIPAWTCDGDECCRLQAGSKKASKKKAATKHYVCPMCSDVCSDKPGNCPKCGMELKEADAKQAHEKHSH